MKIGILTFHRADNYGAVLQNYALQETLQTIGEQPVTIDYRTSNIERWYQVKIFEKRGGVLYRLKNTIWNIYRYNQSIKRKKAFEHFRNKMLNVSEEVNKGNIEQVCDEFDIFICGSDQVWNENIIGLEDIDIYSLKFAKNKYKASYAASAGVTDSISEALLERIGELNYITVRETTLSRFLHKKGLDVVTVCDPVFLISRTDWCKKVGNVKYRNNRAPYLFLYYIDSHRKETCQIARYIAHQRNLKIVYPTAKCKYTLGLGNCVYDEGPFEFILDIINADYVVASSFHAIAFSILFHKEFVVVLHDTTGERVKDLLEKVGLQERIVKGADDFKKREQSFRNIDYKKVDTILADWKKSSLLELRKMCMLAKSNI